MDFADFLTCLVKDAHVAFQRAVLVSEEFRKMHFEERDGVLHPKSTLRRHGDQDVEVPEKTQHQLHDLIPEIIVFDTGESGVDLYEDNGVLKTHLKKGLFDKENGIKIHVRMEFSIHDPPEGVSAQIDKMNDRLKGDL